MDAITATDLVRTFGSTRALDGFSLRVSEGEARGFLGPNGSGKSTTIRILLGLLRQDSGTVRVLGSDPWDDPVPLHRRIAYVPGETALWPNLTGGEVIDILTHHHPHSRARRDALVERFELDPTKKTRAYSKGNRQKIPLIAALAADVELYVFDEPTSGLDPLMEAVFTDEVRALTAKGRTILLSSHILAEVEKLCSSVTIIRSGTDVETGTLSDLRHLTRSRVTATVSANPASLDHPAIHNLAVDGARIAFDCEDAQIGSVMPLLAGLGVRNLTVNPPSLEEMFLQHYGDPTVGR